VQEEISVNKTQNVSANFVDDLWCKGISGFNDLCIRTWDCFSPLGFYSEPRSYSGSNYFSLVRFARKKN